MDTDYRNSRVLITGGLGFIGSNLAQRLVDLGAQVTLVDSLIPEYGGNLFNVREIERRVSINICDVRDPFAMGYLLRGKDFLFNLAGQTSHMDSMSDPMTDLKINAQAQLAILEACRTCNPQVSMVFASTRQLYGRASYLPVDEQHPIRPVDINGINKLAGEWYHLLYTSVYGVRTCALRLTNTYGPHMRVKDARQTFLGIWINNILNGKPIEIFGDGLQLRDFNYVDDCVDALLEAAINPQAVGKVYNLGSSEVINLKDLAALALRVAKQGECKLIPFPPERKKIDIGDFYSDYSLIRKELGWSPKVGLKAGLSATIDYYRQNGSHYW